jgi:hypothetical protein
VSPHRRLWPRPASLVALAKSVRALSTAPSNDSLLRWRSRFCDGLTAVQVALSRHTNAWRLFSRMSGFVPVTFRSRVPVSSAEASHQTPSSTDSPHPVLAVIASPTWLPRATSIFLGQSGNDSLLGVCALAARRLRWPGVDGSAPLPKRRSVSVFLARHAHDGSQKEGAAPYFLERTRTMVRASPRGRPGRKYCAASLTSRLSTASSRRS